MAIAVGDVVVIRNSGLFPAVGPAPRVRGVVVALVANTSINVLWETGVNAAITANAEERFWKVVPPSDAASLPLRRAVHVRGSAQELTGILSDVYIAQADGGENEEVVATMLLTGRGESGADQYLTIYLGAPTTGTAAADKIAAALETLNSAHFPRY